MSSAPLTQAQKARQLMQDKTSKQAGNMLSALVIGLGVAGLVSAALIFTWMWNHSDEISIKSHENHSTATIQENAH